MRIGLVVVFLIGVAGAQDGASKAPCESKLVAKVQANGLRALKITEIPRYYADLKKCKNQTLAKRIRRYNESHQINQDAENSRRMQGFTSGCAYCTVALILYLLLI
ncbi:MAG: hypothetical protein ACE5D2_06305 [Fidelibacterota bacterium]